MNISSKEIVLDIGMAGLEQELIDKMQQINNMEIQLMRKYDSKIRQVNNHANLISHIRKSILTIECMFDDVKSYFTDLNMQFIFQYFRKKHVFIVLTQNYLAEAYMSLLDSKNQKQQQIKPPNQKRVGIRQTKALDIDIRKLQLLDYAINSIDNQEQRLSEELKEMYNGLSLQKNIIRKIKPSTAVNELLLIKENMDQIVKNAQSIFEESYILKYQQFKNYIHKIGKSEDIIDIFYQNINQSFKHKFKEALSKACKLVMKQETKSTSYQDAETQTMGQCKLRKEKLQKEMQKNYTRDKKNLEKLHFENQNLKKIQQQTTKENLLISSNLKAIQEQMKHLKVSYEQLKIMYHQKRDQYDSLKIDSAWALQQKEKIVNKLYEEIQLIKKFKYLTEVGTQYDEFCSSIHTFTQTDHTNYVNSTENQIIKLLKNNHDRSISKLALKQKRIKDLQGNNKEIKTELTKIIDTLLNKFNVPIQNEATVDETGKDYLTRTLNKLSTIKIITPNPKNYRTSIGQEECADRQIQPSLGEQIANRLALIAKQNKYFKQDSSTSEVSMIPQTQAKQFFKLVGNQSANDIQTIQISKSTQTELIRSRMSVIMKNIVHNCNIGTQTGQQRQTIGPNKFKILRNTSSINKFNSLRKPQTSSLTKRQSSKGKNYNMTINSFNQNRELKATNIFGLQDNQDQIKQFRQVKQFRWIGKQNLTEADGEDKNAQVLLKTDYKQSFQDLKLNYTCKIVGNQELQNNISKRQIKTVKSCDRRKSNFTVTKLKNVSELRKENYFLLSVNKIKTEDENFHNFLKFLQNVQNGDNSFIKSTMMKLLQGKTQHKLNKLLFNYILENRNSSEIKSLIKPKQSF